MSGSERNLGIFFSQKSLYYAVHDSGRPGTLARIGAYDFNFDLVHTLRKRKEKNLQGVKEVIGRIAEKYEVDQARLSVHPRFEIWSSQPKLIKDKSDERDAQVNILAKGMNRADLELFWFDLSNHDYKFLVVRNREGVKGYRDVTESLSGVELLSDFEIGNRWVSHSGTRGSFLTVGSYDSVITVASYMLGKLRAATYISFEDEQDLPYLWLQHANHLPWMKGFHEQIYLYGQKTYRLADRLKAYWDDAAAIVKMDDLETMGVTADETTYSFDLELAFPAIMMALEL